MQEIIHHKDQKDIFEFLKDENENCSTCRWLHNGYCTNPASENFKIENTEIQGLDCDYKYHNIDIENYKNTDESTGELL